MKHARKVKRDFDYTPALNTDISVSIERARRRAQREQRQHREPMPAVFRPRRMVAA